MAAFLDLCRFVPTAGGTTDWTYSSTIGGCQSPSQAGATNGVNYKVYAVSSDLTQWEVSQGAYNSSTGTFPRTTVLYNSSGTGTANGQSGAGTKINFSAVPNVAIVGLAEDLLSFDTANSFTATQQNQAQKNLGIPAIIPGYIFGLTLSTAGSSSTFSVAPGVACDGSNADMMTLAASMSKTTAAWVAGTGNGALDTGAIAASTWYWVFEIKSVATQAVDILITKAVAATTPAPTLPSGFTLYRYIGSMLTNASSQWTSFTQYGSSFFWTASVHDVNNASPSSNTDVTATLTVPLGVRVRPMIRISSGANTNATDMTVRSPDLMSAESAPSIDSDAMADSGATMSGASITRVGGSPGLPLYTNTSGQITYRGYFPSGSAAYCHVRTYGWVDDRGAGVISGGGSPASSQQLAPFMRSYLAGLTLSTAGSSATFGVAAGVSADSTNADMMTLAAAFTKTTSAWAAGSGNGALDTGTVVASTWYHVHLIKNSTTQAVDVLISASATAPTLPGGYTLFRRIGSMKTNASSQWTSFQQDGDVFQWSAPTTDVNGANNPGTSAVMRTVGVPPGVRVRGIFAVTVQNAGTAAQQALVLLSDPSMADNVPNNGNLSLSLYDGNSANNFVNGVGGIMCWTNTSQQIRSRFAYSDANIYLYLGTQGWIDRRGKDN